MVDQTLSPQEGSTVCTPLATSTSVTDEGVDKVICSGYLSRAPPGLNEGWFSPKTINTSGLPKRRRRHRLDVAFADGNQRIMLKVAEEPDAPAEFLDVSLLGNVGLWPMNGGTIILDLNRPWRTRSQKPLIDIHADDQKEAIRWLTAFQQVVRLARQRFLQRGSPPATGLVMHPMCPPAPPSISKPPTLAYAASPGPGPSTSVLGNANSSNANANPTTTNHPVPKVLPPPLALPGTTGTLQGTITSTAATHTTAASSTITQNHTLHTQLPQAQPGPLNPPQSANTPVVNAVVPPPLAAMVIPSSPRRLMTTHTHPTNCYNPVPPVSQSPVNPSTAPTAYASYADESTNTILVPHASNLQAQHPSSYVSQGTVVNISSPQPNLTLDACGAPHVFHQYDACGRQIIENDELFQQDEEGEGEEEDGYTMNFPTSAREKASFSDAVLNRQCGTAPNLASPVRVYPPRARANSNETLILSASGAPVWGVGGLSPHKAAPNTTTYITTAEARGTPMSGDTMPATMPVLHHHQQPSAHILHSDTQHADAVIKQHMLDTQPLSAEHGRHDTKGDENVGKKIDENATHDHDTHDDIVHDGNVDDEFDNDGNIRVSEVALEGGPPQRLPMKKALPHRFRTPAFESPFRIVRHPGISMQEGEDRRRKNVDGGRREQRGHREEAWSVRRDDAPTPSVVIPQIPQEAEKRMSETKLCERKLSKSSTNVPPTGDAASLTSKSTGSKGGGGGEVFFSEPPSNTTNTRTEVEEGKSNSQHADTKRVEERKAEPAVSISLSNIEGTRVRLGDMNRFGIVEGIDSSTGKYRVRLEGKSIAIQLAGELLRPMEPELLEEKSPSCGPTHSGTTRFGAPPSSISFQTEHTGTLDDSASASNEIGMSKHRRRSSRSQNAHMEHHSSQHQQHPDRSPLASASTSVPSTRNDISYGENTVFTKGNSSSFDATFDAPTTGTNANAGAATGHKLNNLQAEASSSSSFTQKYLNGRRNKNAPSKVGGGAHTPTHVMKNGPTGNSSTSRGMCGGSTRMSPNMPPSSRSAIAGCNYERNHHYQAPHTPASVCSSIGLKDSASQHDLHQNTHSHDAGAPSNGEFGHTGNSSRFLSGRRAVDKMFDEQSFLSDVFDKHSMTSSVLPAAASSTHKNYQQHQQHLRHGHGGNNTMSSAFDQLSLPSHAMHNTSSHHRQFTSSETAIASREFVDSASLPWGRTEKAGGLYPGGTRLQQRQQQQEQQLSTRDQPMLWETFSGGANDVVSDEEALGNTSTFRGGIGNDDDGFDSDTNAPCLPNEHENYGGRRLPTQNIRTKKEEEGINSQADFPNSFPPFAPSSSSSVGRRRKKGDAEPRGEENVWDDMRDRRTTQERRRPSKQEAPEEFGDGFDDEDQQNENNEYEHECEVDDDAFTSPSRVRTGRMRNNNNDHHRTREKEKKKHKRDKMADKRDPWTSLSEKMSAVDHNDTRSNCSFNFRGQQDPFDACGFDSFDKWSSTASTSGMRPSYSHQSRNRQKRQIAAAAETRFDNRSPLCGGERSGEGMEDPSPSSSDHPGGGSLFDSFAPFEQFSQQRPRSTKRKDIFTSTLSLSSTSVGQGKDFLRPPPSHTSSLAGDASPASASMPGVNVGAASAHAAATGFGDLRSRSKELGGGVEELDAPVFRSKKRDIISRLTMSDEKQSHVPFQNIRPPQPFQKRDVLPPGGHSLPFESDKTNKSTSSSSTSASDLFGSMFSMSSGSASGSSAPPRGGGGGLGGLYRNTRSGLSCLDSLPEEFAVESLPPDAMKTTTEFECGSRPTTTKLFDAMKTTEFALKEPSVPDEFDLSFGRPMTSR